MWRPKLTAPRNKSHRSATAQRRNRARRSALETLEPRMLLSYTFSLSGSTATVSPVAGTGGPILIDEVLIGSNPLLEWSQDNGLTFSTDWDSATPGTQTLPANTSAIINLTPTTGTGSSITLGDPASPASNIFALINLGPPGNPADNSLVVNDRASTHAAGSSRLLRHLGLDYGPGRVCRRDQLHLVRPNPFLHPRGRPSREHLQYPLHVQRHHLQHHDRRRCCRRCDERAWRHVAGHWNAVDAGRRGRSQHC